MAIYWSPAERGFFHDALHAEMPADAMPISDRDHAALMQAQGAGHEIVPGLGGAPMTQPPVGSA